MKKPNVRTNERIEASLYVNTETGETLDSVLTDGSSLILSKPTDKFIHRFKAFVACDVGIEEYLVHALPAKDYQRFKLLCCWLHTEYNVVMAGNHNAHSLQSLAKALSLSVDETTRFIKRMKKEGLILWGDLPDGEFGGKKVLIVNPFVANRRYSFKNYLGNNFRDFEEVKNQTLVVKKKSKGTKATISAETVAPIHSLAV